MTKSKTKEIYKSQISEDLFTILVNMTTRKKLKRFDSFNTATQVNNSIEMIVEVLKERGIVFKKLDLGKKWEVTDFKDYKAYIKLYTNEPVEKGEMTFEAIGMY